ncbi:phage head completion protein [Pseudomonas sp. StFLB209]|uniref:head completion/stabilization protein n=1 Tax=Pseudomonas sp. StFLB209 TaxID=1028989 RepID=UPI0004F73A58|nr:head completion/stabilization protein [Pseudomonas sp. StFLB209]BAP41304.1 phage head completion protein [Pseudomonas sp. StFLB209]
MSGFGGNPTRIVDQAIENDGFWPDLSLAEFQGKYRLPGEYLAPMLVDQLITAMHEVNRDLAALKARWQGSGVSNLESADSTVLPERTFQAATYRRAVYTRAKAELLPQFASVNRRIEAENVGKEAPETRETFLAFSQAAIRSLQGRSRITAVLL